MRESAALDDRGTCLQQWLGTSGDWGDGERVQRRLAKQVMGRSIYSPLDTHRRGTTPFWSFSL